VPASRCRASTQWKYSFSSLGYVSKEEAIELGKKPNLVDEEGIWPDVVLEIKPTGNEGGEIVWEWHQKDHFVQDFDNSKANYGNVYETKTRFDINFPTKTEPDFSHVNAIEYIEEYGIILLSSRNYSEIWIIDHSTSTEEATTSAGGDRNKGGDLQCRWGNPSAYKGNETQYSFYQHNVSWIANEPNSGGNILFFNNGSKRERSYSSVDEVLLVEDGAGNFKLEETEESSPLWSFTHEDLFSESISGAQRLPNGNTLICEGQDGVFYEVTSDKEIVWQYEIQMDKTSCFRATRFSNEYEGIKALNIQED
jgi:hypothetical protein